MRIWLAREALDAMCSEATSRLPLESGGLLLGWRTGRDRVVISILGPGPHALHGRYQFIPDHTWQVSELRRIFTETSGDVDYLGDWHSHPNGEPAMSSEDHSTLHRISKCVAEPLMLIIDNNIHNEHWNVNCWKGCLGPGFVFRSYDAVEQNVKLFAPPTRWSSYSGIVNR